ncbi:MAG: hypothetical protein OHK0039_40790 [Bacteroidia bacterium]
MHCLIRLRTFHLRCWSWVLLCALPLLLAAQGTADTMRMGTFARDFLPVWDRATAYTLAVAEAMPADAYGYRPDSSVFTFGQHLLHLSASMYQLCARYVRVAEVPSLPPPAASLSKDSTLRVLAAAQAYARETLLGLSDSAARSVAAGFWSPDPTPRYVVFLLLRDHITHHRAQAVLYLRLQGIEPPRYTGW